MENRNPSTFFASLAPSIRAEINLTALFDAYRHFIELQERWLESQGTNEALQDELHDVWCQLGDEQQRLPEMVKKYFSAIGRGWNDRNLDWNVKNIEKKSLSDCLVFNFKSNAFVSLSSDEAEGTFVRRMVSFGKGFKFNDQLMEMEEVLTVGNALTVSPLNVKSDYLKLLNLCKKLGIAVHPAIGASADVESGLASDGSICSMM